MLRYVIAVCLWTAWNGRCFGPVLQVSAKRMALMFMCVTSLVIYASVPLQTTKPLRELYVGNLPVGASSTQLQELLGALLQQMGAVTQPGNPIVNVWMSADSHFAFCEFRTIEETNNAQMLNGYVDPGSRGGV